jgi:hypothetical protein
LPRITDDVCDWSKAQAYEHPKPVGALEHADG